MQFLPLYLMMALQKLQKAGSTKWLGLVIRGHGFRACRVEIVLECYFCQRDDGAPDGLSRSCNSSARLPSASWLDARRMTIAMAAFCALATGILIVIVAL